MVRKNDLVTLTVTDMTFDGAGIGHIEDAGRKFPVFIRSAAVGDQVLCRIIKVLKSYAVGIVSRILSPSPDRISPRCPVAEKCGGCAFQHVSYSAELKYKSNAVRQAYKLNFPGNITVKDCLPSPETEGYRNKVQLPLSSDGKFGFYSLHSHRVVPICDCTAGHRDFFPVISAVEEWIGQNRISAYDEASGKGLVRHLFLRRGYHTGEIMVCLAVNAADRSSVPSLQALISRLSGLVGVKSIFVNYNTQKTNVILGDRFELLWGEERIADVMNGVRFFISPRSFYQINTAQAERIYAEAAARLSSEDVLLDLYCGIGTIGLTCAHRVQSVVGIEVVDAAIEDAKRNAKENGIKNAKFFTADAAKTTEILAALPQKPTVVIVDPPRKGLSSDAIAALKSIGANKIIYISCNPATQARDLARLSDLYTPGDVQPYDMFPRTGHVETVVCLGRKDTVHNMKLRSSPFEMIKSGRKTIELRLFDEKRQQMKAGDKVVFTNTATGETLNTTVVKLHRFNSFEELYKSLSLLECGYTAEEADKAHPSDMEQYYSAEEQKKYGVVGIELCPQKQISDQC